MLKGFAQYKLWPHAARLLSCAGVNVAAFLLMDSQKDSTSPGHPTPAQPLSGIQLLCTCTLLGSV